MKSWKTTMAGLGSLLVIIGTVLSALFDGNPNTNPDWSQAIAGAIASVGLIFAKDHKGSDKGTDTPG